MQPGEHNHLDSYTDEYMVKKLEYEIEIGNKSISDIKRDPKTAKYVLDLVSGFLIGIDDPIMPEDIAIKMRGTPSKLV